MKYFLLGITILISTIISFGQTDPVDINGLAIGGYDVVSYFTKGKATKGQPDINTKYQGATYRFESDENKKLFEASPQKYLPQYDGYCALAVATTAKKISVNPELFRVTDGKLYLFFHGKSFSGDIFNSLEPWVKSEQQMIQSADTNWPKVKQKKYAPKKN